MTEKTARAEDEAAPPTEATAPAPSTALEREHADMKDRLLRTLAEMENLRKRTDREIADSRLYGVSSFARDMLNVADNMRRALDAVPAELRADADPNVKALIEGVDLTERELQKALEKNGIRQFSRKARNSIRICIRRCSKCPIRRCRPAAWCKWCSLAT